MNDKMSLIKVKDLVLLGGGHAHVHVIRMIGMKKEPGIEVTLITRDLETPYSGMIPGYISGYYSKDECHIDLVKLCSFAKVNLIYAEADGLDTKNKLIYLKDNRPPIRYDVLSIDIGISPKHWSQNNNDNSNCNLTPVKPIDGFAKRWDIILNRVLNMPTDPSSDNINIAIIGGGAGGTELTFAIEHRLRVELTAIGKDPSKVKIMLLQRGNTLMSSHNIHVQNVINRLIIEKGIELIFNAEVIGTKIESNQSYLLTSDGRQFLFNEAISCAEAMAQSWLLKTDLETTQNGFICVNDTLESVNVRDVFACGDVAHLINNPRPKAGVFAVRAGPPLVANLRKRLRGIIDLDPWIPQNEFLGIIGTGNGYAIASKGAYCVEGEYIWKLKDKIDRKWMLQYQEFPDMNGSTKDDGSTAENEAYVQLTQSMGESTISVLEKQSMRCGGCGSKVGAQVLSRVLDRVKYLLHKRSEVIGGIDGNSDDCAVVKVPQTPGAYMVHSIDYFRSFISDPYLMGQIAANHALSDVFAMNGEPVTALALCVVPYGLESRIEETLVHVLAGMMKTLQKEGCTLAGGHTSEGAELALGLSVNGVVNPDRILKKGPVEEGNVLILTKALGTGTIMAADMRAKAKGRWVGAAFESMLQSNAAAAKIFCENNATACTDVTGFGFLGHLLEMLKYSSNNPDSYGAKIQLGDVPLLPGAEECVKNGIFSSLYPENIRCKHAIDNIEIAAGHPAYPLLFDPQTSGGLIASVPYNNATNVITKLHAAGYDQACVVGNVYKRQNESEFEAYVILER